MFQQLSTSPLPQGKRQGSAWTPIFVGLIIGILLCLAAVASGYVAHAILGKQPSIQSASATPLERHVQLKLKIVLNQPGYQNDGQALCGGQLHLAHRHGWLLLLPLF
jgi:hypothetical protein